MSRSSFESKSKKSLRPGMPAVEVVEKELHLDLGEHEQAKVRQVSLAEPLRIGVDGNEANVEHRVGSNQYAYEVLRALKEAGPQHEWVVYLKEPPLAHMPKPGGNWQYRVIGPRRLWTQVGLPFDLWFRKPRPQVWFSPGHYAPRWSPVPVVVAIMDVAFLKFPQFFRKRDYEQLKRWTERSVRRAVQVITISQHTKNDVVAEYGVEPEKVTVAHPGYGRELFSFPQPDVGINQVKKKYGIGDDYFLYLGTLQPRKNLVRLVEAFASFILKTRSSKLKVEVENYQLVVAGKKGWMYEEIFAKVRALRLEKRVVFVGFVPDGEVPPLMAGARALCFPALYEGFGIPVVEAMAVGTPAIVSNTASLPEIIDHAGLVVNPYRVEEISGAMRRFAAMSDEEYHKLVDKGLEHSHRHFSWENCAARTLEVLEEVGQGREG